MSIQDLDPLLTSLLGKRHTAHTHFDAPPQTPWDVCFWLQKDKKRYTLSVRISPHGWQRRTIKVQTRPDATDRLDPQIIQGVVHMYRGNPYFPYRNVLLIKLIP